MASVLDLRPFMQRTPFLVRPEPRTFLRPTLPLAAAPHAAEPRRAGVADCDLLRVRCTATPA